MKDTLAPAQLLEAGQTAPLPPSGSLDADETPLRAPPIQYYTFQNARGVSREKPTINHTVAHGKCRSTDTSPNPMLDIYLNTTNLPDKLIAGAGKCDVTPAERTDVTSLDGLTPPAQQGVLAVPMKMRLCDFKCNRTADVTIGRIEGSADCVTAPAKLAHEYTVIAGTAGGRTGPVTSVQDSRDCRGVARFASTHDDVPPRAATISGDT
ncbi:hypothetical protein CSOJ01_11043 [Colletotrichum sojae]|uniref:Uncharacterized protein n=1 Tax=Colletotrichum sojae TaxID=2175907 RepID=A0A8H6IZ90_9PEZI|nr:hypothetical protein CSOJ01_11043 [Colletotrichum sojae]